MTLLTNIAWRFSEWKKCCSVVVEGNNCLDARDRRDEIDDEVDLLVSSRSRLLICHVGERNGSEAKAKKYEAMKSERLKCWMGTMYLEEDRSQRSTSIGTDAEKQVVVYKPGENQTK